MKFDARMGCGDRSGARGFTLVEVVISMAILGMVIEGVFLGYAKLGQQAEWSARSLAAQSLASEGAEQARAAKWDLQQWPQGVGPGQSDELGITNYARTGVLDVPMTGQPILATNYVSITAFSANPPVRQIRSDCVWNFMGRGVFTNSVIVLRASDE